LAGDHISQQAKRKLTGQIAENPLLTDAPSASESFSENEGHAILPSSQPMYV